jgi:hypothetical protein
MTNHATSFERPCQELETDASYPRPAVAFGGRSLDRAAA